MPLLARSELVRRLATRNLVVSPLIHDKQIQAAAIDLRMGNMALLVRSRGLSHVEPANYRKNGKDNLLMLQGQQQKLEKHEIPFDQPFLLHPGTLALVPTLEWVHLPDDILGVVTARSSWAREGLNIATASFINPNYKGIITLELANLGEIPIQLYPGLRLAQIAFSVIAHSAEEGQKKPVALETSQFDGNFEPSAGYLLDDYLDPFLPAEALSK